MMTLRRGGLVERVWWSADMDEACGGTAGGAGVEGAFGRKPEVSEAALKVAKSSTPATRHAVAASTSNLHRQHRVND